jgi:hypothetical protein
MATLSLNDTLTPIEMAKRFGDKSTIFIIESLSETNELLLDAVIGEASDGTVNRTVQRATLPVGTRRIYGAPIAAEASATRQIEDGIEMLEAYSDIDADMADHSPNKQAFIDSEDKAFLEGLGQTQAQDLLYARRYDGLEYIDGIYARFPATADNQSVFKVETSGSNLTSIILVKWAEDKAKLIYPRGVGGLGVSAEWRGKQDVTVQKADGSLGTLPMYRTFYKTHFGITVRHPMAIKRICNINPTAMTSANAEAILAKLIQAKNKLPKGNGTIVAYMNADVLTILEEYTVITRSLYTSTKDDPWGRPTTMLGEIRFRRQDTILSTESLVS